jgi:hypothetical protein
MPMDADVMLKIDQLLDDGNLTTGTVRQHNASQISYQTYTQQRFSSADVRTVARGIPLGRSVA